MNRKLASCITLLLALFVFPTISSGTGDETVSILVGDDPTEIISLESFSITPDGYMLVDSRNNQARVKYIDKEGNIISTAVSTIPLPDAASLPPDVLASPWGLDRLIEVQDGLWAVPAKWSGAVAEHFDSDSGDFIERLPDPGLTISGMISAPDGDVWAVGRRMLVNVSENSTESLNLGSSLMHIDSAVGHPLGFLVYTQPDLVLIDSNNITRWKLELDTILNFYLSPIDIAAGPDGSTGIVGVMCDLSKPEDNSEYNEIRDGSLAREDETTLFNLEEALRANLGVAYVLVMVDAEGNVTDFKQMDSYPVACDVDEFGRFHVLVQEEEYWGIYIWDPAMGTSLDVCTIPFGIPAMITPHVITSGRDGSLYWDDLIPEYAGEKWGIAKLADPGGGSVFGLGSTQSGNTEWVYSESLTNTVRQASSLAVDNNGDIWAGLQDIVIDFSNPEGIANPTFDGQPFDNHVIKLDRDGNLLLDKSTIDLTGEECSITGLLAGQDAMITSFGSTAMESPIGIMDSSGNWEPSSAMDNENMIVRSGIGELADSYIAWFLIWAIEGTISSWYTINNDLDGVDSIDLFGLLGCRLLAADPGSNIAYVTIDDGDIFRINMDSLYVDGIWSCRNLSGATGHSLDDATVLADGLAVLDKERRAIMLIPEGAFLAPALAADYEVDDSIELIRTELEEHKSLYGSYPEPSPGLLDDILSYSDREIARQAFIGGQVYHYTITDVGYRFVVWSAAADQPGLLVTHYETTTVY